MKRDKRETRPPNTVTNLDGFETWQRQLGTTTRSATSEHIDASAIRVPGLTILWHPNPFRIGERTVFTKLSAQSPTPVSRLEPDFIAPHHTTRRPLADPYMSRQPIQFSVDKKGRIHIDRGNSNTSVEVNGAPVQTGVVIAPEELEPGVVLLLAKRVVVLFHLQSPPQKRLPELGLIGESRGLLKIKQEILKVTELQGPVLLIGESGTGKELVARAIHQLSNRQERPFLSINMGAIPANLAASELFGAKRGAYSGADHNRPGFFQRADTGTLFLDEIGETSSEAQVMLLRTLETGEIQPVGAEQPQKVDVRVIAATDKNLIGAVERGEFRLPLFHRLASFEVSLPPLRERREDFGRLLLHFLQTELVTCKKAKLTDPGPDGKPWLPAKLVSHLALSAWPGNIRQLRNVVRRIVIDSRDDGSAHIDDTVWRLAGLDTPDPGEVGGRPGAPRKPISTAGPASYREPWEVEEAELLTALKKSRYNLKRAADLLGVSRASLYALIDDCPKVRKAGDLTREEIAASFARCDGNLDIMVDELEVSKRGLQMRMKELGMR